MSFADKLENAARTDNLEDRHPENDSSSSDEEDSDDAMTSYDGSSPSSPIESFGNPSQASMIPHPDNSQFSMVATVGTPTILCTAQSSVLSAPSLIRDAQLAAAPYSTSSPTSGSGRSSRSTSTPSTRPPSRGPALPATAAAFGLPPPTASPAPHTLISYVPETLASASAPAVKLPSPPVKTYPFIEKVEVAEPVVDSTLPGIVLEEWCAFMKAVLNYNLSLNLYKLDLDWKKANMAEPHNATALAEYHLCIGQANQRVGAVAIMECTIGQYIHTVGADLVEKQAKLSGLELTCSDIEWHLAQGAKDTGKVLTDENVPQEDLAPSLFLPPLLATPSPAASLLLPQDTPLSSLTSLPSASDGTNHSPVILELATPHVMSFAQLSNTQPTPKAAPMDISPPRVSSSSQGPLHSGDSCGSYYWPSSDGCADD